MSGTFFIYSSEMSASQLQITPAYAISYVYKNALYINSTSRCPSACKFCIKFSWDYRYRGSNLKLPADPSIEEILASVPSDLTPFEEVVYCGYGESTYRLADLPALSHAFRKRGAHRIRMNSIGLGNLIHGRDIAPELSPVVDAISISMNTMDPQRYLEMVRPLPEFRSRAFESAQEFCASCVKHIPDTTLTSIDAPEFDAPAVERFARKIGAQFRLRPYL